MPCSPIRVSRPQAGRRRTRPAATSSACGRSAPSRGVRAARAVRFSRDRHREQRRVLERGRDRPCAARAGVRSRMSTPSMRDRARGDVVEARQQRGEHRSCRIRSRRPGRASRPGSTVEVDVVQDRRASDVGEPEPDVDELAARRRGGTSSRRAVGDVGLGVEDLGDPVGRRHRLLGHRQQEAQRRDRPHQRQHQGDERDQRAHRHQAVAGGERAEAAARGSG